MLVVSRVLRLEVTAMGSLVGYHRVVGVKEQVVAEGLEAVMKVVAEKELEVVMMEGERMEVEKLVEAMEQLAAGMVWLVGKIELEVVEMV